jgi:hypothetical protein
VSAVAQRHGGSGQKGTSMAEIAADRGYPRRQQGHPRGAALLASTGPSALRRSWMRPGARSPRMRWWPRWWCTGSARSTPTCWVSKWQAGRPDVGLHPRRGRRNLAHGQCVLPAGAHIRAGPGSRSLRTCRGQRRAGHSGPAADGPRMVGGRSAGLRGRQAMFASSFAAVLGLAVIVLKDVVLTHLH